MARGENFNRGDPSTAAGGSSSSDPVIGSLVRPGQTIGDFELREVIGRGGMGTVYKAWQLSLRRLVAVKVLAPHISSSRASVLRFQREAQAAAKLHHPNIVPIFSLGDEGGTYFYAMELIEGRGLHEIIREERQRAGLEQPEEDLNATRIVRRDNAKPEAGQADDSGPNFALTSSGTGISPASPLSGNASRDRYLSIAEHMVRVADALDYAHRQGVIHRDIKPHNLMMSRDGRLLITDFGLARVTEQPGITMTSECIGSPLYMAPELINGSSEADCRSDVYSLAATLYEWMTLRPPFPGKTREAVVAQILAGDLREPRHYVSAIPPDLETICLKGMDRDPRRRYATAADFRDDMLAFLGATPVKARRAGVMDRARRAVARRPIAALVIMLVVLTVGSAAVIVRQSAMIDRIKLAQNQSQNQPSHISPDVRSSGEPSRGAATAAQDSSPSPAPGVDASTAGPKSFSDLLPAEAFVVEVVKKVVADSAPALREQAESLAKTPLTALLFDSDMDDYGTLAGLNRAAATEIFERSILRNDLFPVDPLMITEKIENLLTALRDPDHEKWINKLDGMLLVLPQDRTVRYVRAVLYFKTGRYADMASDAARLVEGGTGDVSAHLLHALALILSGDVIKAESDIAAAMKIDPNNDLIYGLRGLMQMHLTTPGSAIRSFQEALTRNNDSVLALMGLAMAYMDQNEPLRAMPLFDQVLELQPTNVDALVAHGDCATRLQQYAQAKKDLSSALTLEGGTSKSIAAKLFAVVSAELTAQVRSTSGGGSGSTPASRTVLPENTQIAPDAASHGDLSLPQPGGDRALAMPTTWRRP